MGQASLASVQIGKPQSLGSDGATDPFDAAWTSGIFKNTVAGSVRISSAGVEGDAQADLAVHGGPDKAICAYSANHYPGWRRTLGLTPFEHGAFGENFTIGGLTEDDVCIGDTWEIGGALIQVSQPRQPCWKLARKWRIKTLTDLVVKSGQTGWYFRVLREGVVSAGMTFTLVDRPNPRWTISAANNVMHHRKADRDAAATLAAVPLLSSSWRESLTRRATQG